jgi:hypothetical protein
MNSLRKWRFPILIGSGLIAAGILVYFSSAHISSDKTQGAIGKRDVYRDGQVASADVATPGSAPVATQAILESSDFKSLAKDPAFQKLVSDPAFQDLSRQSVFVTLLSDLNFRQLVLRKDFTELITSDLFRQGLRRSNQQEMMMHWLSSDSHASAAYSELIRMSAFNELLRQNSFRDLTANNQFQGLMRSQELQQALSVRAFADLTSRMEFRQSLLAGSAQQMRAELSRN